MRITRLLVSVTIAGLTAACGAAPPPSVAPKAPSTPVAQKLSWILRMEDERILRVPPPPEPAPQPVAPAAQKKKGPPAPPPAPVVTPDLTTLVSDADPRIRRRAALAIGRVGLPEGVPALQPVLSDTDSDVRQMAAFALGLLTDKSSVPALTTLLQDPEPRVRGRAAEALGLIGDTGSAAAVGQMVAGYIQQGAIASFPPDDEQWPKTPEADAVRLGLFALVRQKGWGPLASAVLDANGRPVSTWWPVAFALQRIGDPRAQPALEQLAKVPGRYTRSFAVRGLGALKDRSAVPMLLDMLAHAGDDPALSYSIIDALGRIGAPQSVATLIALLSNGKTDPNVRLEALTALAAMKSQQALPYADDLLTDDWPTMRVTALRACFAIDPQGFITLLSGLEPDRHWMVRSAMAELLGMLPPDVAVDRLRRMLDDSDKRVVGSVIESLTRLRAPGLNDLLLAQIKSQDEGIRIAAARSIGQARIPGGAAALREAYHAWASDPALHDAREAALTALARYGAQDAAETVKAALADSDWALRVHAAALMHDIDPAFDAVHAIRPAPGPSAVPYDSPDLIDPQISPHAFIETAKGTIEFEFTVLDAPQTVQNFIALARKGYFNGLQIHRVVPNFVIQDGDPRGDGSGGPGYTIRDELNDWPFVRGTVGMALSGPDTGGSQFFIMHSPAPHLDGKYTVFGHVVNGIEVIDKIAPLDVIERVRIWDGKELK